jgi:CcmD family protein
MFYLTAAFIGLWLLVTIYVLYLGQRQGQLEQELRALEETRGERGRV